MKKLLTILALGSLTLTACMDGDWDIPQNIQDNPPYGNNEIQKYTGDAVVTVAQLKTANKSTVDNNRVTEITDDVQLQVVVNGNDAGGNLYKQISVQDETGGIIVGINATAVNVLNAILTSARLDAIFVGRIVIPIEAPLTLTIAALVLTMAAAWASLVLTALTIGVAILVRVLLFDWGKLVDDVVSSFACTCENTSHDYGCNNSKQGNYHDQHNGKRGAV